MGGTAERRPVALRSHPPASRDRPQGEGEALMGDGENEKRLTPEERHEQLTKAARRIVDAEKSAQDKKTAKLKAQRLANEPREPNTAPLLSFSASFSRSSKRMPARPKSWS